jgi:hypothetical protein
VGLTGTGRSELRQTRELIGDGLDAGHAATVDTVTARLASAGTRAVPRRIPYP